MLFVESRPVEERVVRNFGSTEISEFPMGKVRAQEGKPYIT